MNIFDSIVLPVSDYYTGWNVKQALHFLIKSQWWSPVDIKEYQTRLLRDLIDHAYAHVPYYTNLFNKYGLKPQDIREVQDLKKIPVLTKKDLHDNFINNKIIAKNIELSNCLLRHSSGSTGQKTQYYITKEAYGFNLACNLRGWNWMGYRLGDILIKVSQNKRKSIVKGMQDFLNRTHLYTGHYDKEGIERFINLFNRIKPSFIRSYPDPLLFIASNTDRRLLKHYILGINTTGNILFPEVREKIEGFFETQIFDSYSCEGGANVFECPTHSCYHSSMEYAITEVIDSEGKEADLGKSGVLITTDLHNYATPMIRYESKDIVTKGNECTCGRNLMSIKTIQGRDNDIVVTPKKEYLIAQTFTTFFKYYENIEYFQIHQTAINKLEIKLKVNKHFNTQEENEIINHWRLYTDHQMNVTINLLNEIPLLSSGKRRFIIRNKNIPLF